VSVGVFVGVCVGAGVSVGVAVGGTGVSVGVSVGGTGVSVGVAAGTGVSALLDPHDTIPSMSTLPNNTSGATRRSII